MDNFFIIGKTHFGFFNYIIDNIGLQNLKYTNNNDSYIIGPEIQFISLLNSYFTNIIYFNTLITHFEISFGIINNKNKNCIIYTSKNTNGICFGKYINNLLINSSNYYEVFSKDKNFLLIKMPSFLKKFNDIECLFYTIV